MRRPLCSYYSPDRLELTKEVKQAYLSCRGPPPPSGTADRRLLGLVVPHGAACDGFHVAADAYRHLNAYLSSRRCRHLTAVLLGTEHAGTTPVAASRLDWDTPLGIAAVDAAAVDFLAAACQPGIPVNEAPHSKEHSIENQLPFLLHGAAHGWDLRAAGCEPHHQQPSNTVAAAAAVAASHTSSAGQQGGGITSSSSGMSPAQLSIVPISIGYLGHQQGLIHSTATCVRQLLHHLRQQQHHHQNHHPASAAGSSGSSGSGGSSSSGHEVVLIVTSDFTHAGPWYRELPPPGVSLQDYMARQDMPVLQAVQQGSSSALLAAAAATRNSMCGLYPLAVALEVLYGGGGSRNQGGGGGGSGGGAASGSDSSSTCVAADPPLLLDYRPAHLIFPRADSTGFAAFAVYSSS